MLRSVINSESIPFPLPVDYQSSGLFRHSLAKYTVELFVVTRNCLFDTFLFWNVFTLLTYLLFFQAKEDQGEEKRRGLMKQLRDLEAELEDERKQRAAALSVRKKLEADLKDMEQQLEINNKLKEDAVKQLKKLQVR